jgi:predicted alpha/beta hydrolase family esterase
VRAPHLLDLVFARSSRAAPSFVRGYGDEAVLDSFRERRFDARFAEMLREDLREPRWGDARASRVWPGVRVRDGQFASPFDGLPSPVDEAHVRELSAPRRSPVGALVVLAASREEGYATRELVWGPLVRDGYRVYLLENPYYGKRRARHQTSPSLSTVSEQLVMNVASVLEAGALLETLARAHADLPIGVVGYSMGGYMAALTAALYPRDIFTCVFACGAAAAPIFIEGLLARSVDFQAISRERLRHVLDAVDLLHFPPPRRSDAAVIVAATRDGFVQPHQVERLHAHWRSSRVVWKDGGHVSLLLRHHGALRAAVRDAAAVLKIAR